VSEQAASVVQAPASEVGGGRRPLSGGQKIGVFAIVGAVAVALILLRGTGTPKPAEDKPVQADSVGAAGADFKPPPAGAFTPNTTPSPAASTTLPMPQQQVFPDPIPRNQVDPAQKARESDILSGTGTAPPTTPAGSPAGPAGTAGTDERPLATLLKPTLLEGAKAGRLPHPDMTITMGTPFPCIPQEPLTSDAPGLVTCIVPVDVRGTTGRVVLLDRGTKVVGTVQSALLQGRSRLFVLWQRAETPNPNHVIINLNSPAADQLGEAGLEGDIDTHFWQRFGGAIMLSFIDSGLQAAAAAASSTSGNNAVSFSSFSSNGQSAASTALQNTINIPPTLHRDQALPATVFVARDLDFSDVYGLAVTR
jgi:type IV secretion system protein VirB10